VAAEKAAGAIFVGSETLFMPIFTAVIILYTFIGGQVSLVRADLIQFIIILIGVAVFFTRTEGGP
jgi:Na+/proline symporter